MNPPCELNQALDSLANDLSRLMNDAFLLLRQCQAQLRDFKGLRQPGRGSDCEMLESEIASLLASTAERYRRAGVKAQAARSVFDALVARATRASAPRRRTSVSVSAAADAAPSAVARLIHRAM